MDRPQYQVMGRSGESYRYMGYPFQKQQLQLLYPGRPMESYYHYTGDNIPNSNPVGLTVTKNVDKTLSDVSMIKNESLARAYGGVRNVVNYPAVEPDAPIEDPRLLGLTMNDTSGINPNLHNVYSPYDNLSKSYHRQSHIVDHVRGKDEGRIRRRHYPDETLPRYDWEEIPEREYPITHVSPGTTLFNNHSQKKKHTYPNE